MNITSYHAIAPGENDGLYDEFGVDIMVTVTGPEGEIVSTDHEVWIAADPITYEIDEFDHFVATAETVDLPDIASEILLEGGWHVEGSWKWRSELGWWEALIWQEGQS